MRLPQHRAGAPDHGDSRAKKLGVVEGAVRTDLEVDLKIKLPGFLVKKGQKAAAETAKKGLTAEAEKRAK